MTKQRSDCLEHKKKKRKKTIKKNERQKKKSGSAYKNTKKKRGKGKRTILKSKQPSTLKSKLKFFARMSEHFFFLLIVLIFLFILINFRGHRVSGVSMEPTLTNGDRVVIHRQQTPKRYDIITLVPAANSKDNFIKRIVGIPGDRFYVDGTHLYLFPSGTEFDSTEALNDSNKLPDSTIVLFLSEEIAEELKEFEEIPKDCYFVVGDNRRISEDSRYFSFVKRAQIEGVLVFRLFPLSQVGIVH